jgi:gamma-glutamylcyclotransferase (GGCT)/AIG2-like uncharacterized protein YtfP
VFVYGTLVEPARLETVLGHRHLGERLRARLAEYRRVRVPEFEYPFIVPSRGAAVDGILLMDLSPDELETLDAYEELDQGTYLRTGVEVEVWGCGPRTMRVGAQTYVGGAALVRLSGSATPAARSTTS